MQKTGCNMLQDESWVHLQKGYRMFVLSNQDNSFKRSVLRAQTSPYQSQIQCNDFLLCKLSFRHLGSTNMLVQGLGFLEEIWRKWASLTRSSLIQWLRRERRDRLLKLCINTGHCVKIANARPHFYALSKPANQNFQWKPVLSKRHYGISADVWTF